MKKFLEKRLICKNNKGITLIALVVTIIVLLILAAISISMLTGDNSILKRAADAKIKTERQNIVEQARADVLGYQANNKGTDLERTQLKAVLDKYFKSVPTEVDLPDGEELFNMEFETQEKYGMHKIKVFEIFDGKIKELEPGLYNEEGFTPWNTLKEKGITSYDGNRFRIIYNSEEQRDTIYGKLVLNNDIIEIDSGAFMNLNGLTEIKISNSVKSIDAGAFNFCSGLKKIVIPENVTTFNGAGHFIGCTNLKNVTLGSDKNDGMNLIPVGVFNGTSFLDTGEINLESITIKKSIKTIKSNAFTNIGIENVYYTGTKAEWKSMVIEDGNNCLTDATIICTDGIIGDVIKETTILANVAKVGDFIQYNKVYSNVSSVYENVQTGWRIISIDKEQGIVKLVSEGLPLLGKDRDKINDFLDTNVANSAKNLEVKDIEEACSQLGIEFKKETITYDYEATEFFFNKDYDNLILNCEKYSLEDEGIDPDYGTTGHMIVRNNYGNKIISYWDGDGSNDLGIRPVITLKTNIKANTGNGTKAKPYNLIME